MVLLCMRICSGARAHLRFGSDGAFYFTEMPPPGELLKVFAKRDDGQIMGLEMLAFALGQQALIVAHGAHAGACP